MTDFWKSAGFHLVTRDAEGWLHVTPDFLRAYLTRPEIHPVAESCAAETALFERLMADPFAAVAPSDPDALADPDTAANYRVVLRFRDHLAAHGTLEAAYSALFSGDPIAIPPVFIDQMVHLILRNILDDETDPITLRAAELLFREQIATIGEDRLMLADAEVVEMQAASGEVSFEQLIGGANPREVSLDVLTTATADEYWSRSDRFDTAIDFRFTEPGPDALARVLSRWIAHFLKVETRIQAVKSIRDDRWTWHVGLDAEATRLLNALYAGETPEEAELAQIIALYRLEFLDETDALDRLRGKPVYLGLAVTPGNRLVLKPQNLLTNLPVRRS